MSAPGQPSDSVDVDSASDDDEVTGEDPARTDEPDDSPESAASGDTVPVDGTEAEHGSPGEQPNGFLDGGVAGQGPGYRAAEAPDGMEPPPLEGSPLEPRPGAYEPLPTPDVTAGEQPSHVLPAGVRPKVNMPRMKNLPRPRPRVKRAGKAGGGRVVTERLRHVSPLAVLKISGIFFTCVALILAVSVVLLWQLARGTGMVDDTESFVTQLFTYGNCVAEEDVELGQEAVDDDRCPTGEVLVGGFEVDDGALFLSVVFSGIIFTVAASGGMVLLTLLFNLLSDITGGVRYSIVREPVGGRTSGGTGSTGPPEHG